MNLSTPPETTSTPRSADLNPGPGFRIKKTRPQIDTSIIDRLAAFEIPDISDKLNRLFAMDSAIKPMNHYADGVVPLLAGPVTTVQVFPGDNLMVHKVLDIAQPGDIVVIDGHGDQSVNAIIGDMICMKAMHRGIAGFVVDGLVRDMPGVDEIGFPVWARGVTAVGPLHRGPGEINFPVACGGIVVNPGDALLADATGLVIVPNGHIGKLVDELEASQSAAAAYAEQVRQGDFSMAWVDDLLYSAGCETDLT